MPVQITFSGESPIDVISEVIAFARTVDTGLDTSAEFTKTFVPDPAEVTRVALAETEAVTEMIAAVNEPKTRRTRGSKKSPAESAASPPAQSAATSAAPPSQPAAPTDPLEIPSFLKGKDKTAKPGVNVFDGENNLIKTVEDASEAVPMIIARVALAESPEELDALLSANSGAYEQLASEHQQTINDSVMKRLAQLGVDPANDGGDGLDGENTGPVITEDGLKDTMRKILAVDNKYAAELSKLLKKYGAAKLQEVKSESFPAFYADLNALAQQVGAASAQLF